MTADQTFLYRTMRLIRTTEENLARLHARGLAHGACHTYVGQEAIATGVCVHPRLCCPPA
jgi:TPP-dependent pyruvate/acetoin dehydrogenase alpha subunit